MAKEWTEKELQAELIATLNQCEWRRALDGGISAEANLRADPQTIIADVYQHLRERVSVKLVCEPHTYQIAFSSEAADHLQDRGLEICPPIPEAADCVDASTCTDRESLVSELNKLKWSCQNGVFSAETTIAGSRTKFARDVVAYVAEMASLNYDKERGNISPVAHRRNSGQSEGKRAGAFRKGHRHGRPGTTACAWTKAAL